SDALDALPTAATTPAEVRENWDAIKRTESTSGEPLGEIPDTLPALLHARKLQRRAAGGIDRNRPEDAVVALRASLESLADAVAVSLRSGAHGRAAVPSGASTGEFEAVELRDGGELWGGKGVMRAVDAVNGEIARAVSGLAAEDQREVDRTLIELDGTPNKAR